MVEVQFGKGELKYFDANGSDGGINYNNRLFGIQPGGCVNNTVNSGGDG